MKVVQLKEQNRLLRQRIQEFKSKRHLGPELKGQIQSYVTKSKNTIDEMNEKSIAEQQQSNRKLHQITQKYQIVLKEQIALLTENKNLSEKKDGQDKKLNEEVQKLTKEYESQIAEFEKKVKVNVKRIQELGGTNIIKKLIKNQRFKAAMAERGCNLQGLEQQSQLEQVAEEVEQREKLIEAAQLKSATLDEQLQKMQQLIETMKELMDNMQKEKENILKQNTILKQKLQQSQQLIGKLLGKNAEADQDDNEEVQADGQQEEKLDDQ